jgi:hypothetical protein
VRVTGCGCRGRAPAVPSRWSAPVLEHVQRKVGSRRPALSQERSLNLDFRVRIGHPARPAEPETGASHLDGRCAPGQTAEIRGAIAPGTRSQPQKGEEVVPLKRGRGCAVLFEQCLKLTIFVRSQGVDAGKQLSSSRSPAPSSGLASTAAWQRFPVAEQPIDPQVRIEGSTVGSALSARESRRPTLPCRQAGLRNLELASSRKSHSEL